MELSEQGTECYCKVNIDINIAACVLSFYLYSLLVFMLRYSVYYSAASWCSFRSSHAFYIFDELLLSRLLADILSNMLLLSFSSSFYSYRRYTRFVHTLFIPWYILHMAKLRDVTASTMRLIFRTQCCIFFYTMKKPDMIVRPRLLKHWSMLK